MSRRVERREVDVTIIVCDLCGGEKEMARYAENRRCHNCGREVCNNCQTLSEYCTECVVCTLLGATWWPKINGAYEEYERLKKEYKACSLEFNGPVKKGGSK